ncbi:uncharacterized protein N7459_004390 [Penicillium hispanicum]|uniref:uncharacterized protein n=1 Tax=Penicillium hispanicum TaxID=1080232 RepID=UPI00254141B1|nr:uncharacterized protein N7459_004390 [Penicillium hispanicum]KAJ5584590.1 hypothetical protein N7459_004390 [Penicillium hispanicum]
MCQTTSTTIEQRNPPISPNLSLVIRDNEFLQPSKEQEHTALEMSRASWYHTASLAYDFLDNGLTPNFTNPQLALHKIPKFQGRLKSPFAYPLGVTLDLALCSLVSSTWKVTGDSNCDAVNKETTKPALIQIGTSRAIPYSFCGRVFGHWIGTKTEKTTGPNFLGILAIGWCYVLSARLVEMQGGSATMCYTTSQADCFDKKVDSPPEEPFIIDIGATDMDPKVVRWWSAILAKREGWKATLNEKFVTPWTVSRTREKSFIIKQGRGSLHSKGSISSVQTPLSSEEAFDALLQFAHFHGLGSQFPISLTIAMSFPMHRYYGTDVELPVPRAHGGNIPTVTPDGPSRIWMNMRDDLPYYMTLSCSPEVMISTLCGAFWQPDVPCNMVSQWLHPVLEEVLGDAAEGKDQELMALIGAIRRPSVGALWIGAAASGMGPKLLQKVRRGRPPVESVGFPWTGAPQSFMDDTGSGPYTCEDPAYISRPDVWRLLNLPPTEEDDMSYGNRPMTPWEPCGVSSTTNCALRVTSHLKCPRHEYHYDHWNWELEDGTTIQDNGFLRSYPSFMAEGLSNTPDIKEASHSFEKKELDSEREASEEASIDIFHWFVVGGEGLPPEKIYYDDLLQEIWRQEDDYGEELDEADERVSQKNRHKENNRVETWLATISGQDHDQSEVARTEKSQHQVLTHESRVGIITEPGTCGGCIDDQ